MKTVSEKEKITRDELAGMAKRMFGGLVKAVVDVEREMMVVDADLHADEEAVLLEAGSEQENLWGINLYPDEAGEGFIEFDSMINVRPRQDNRSRNVESLERQASIRTVVSKLIV